VSSNTAINNYLQTIMKQRNKETKKQRNKQTNRQTDKEIQSYTYDGHTYLNKTCYKQNK